MFYFFNLHCLDDYQINNNLTQQKLNQANLNNIYMNNKIIEDNKISFNRKSKTLDDNNTHNKNNYNFKQNKTEIETIIVNSSNTLNNKCNNQMNNLEKNQKQSSPINNLKKYQARPSYFRVMLTSKTKSFFGKIRLFCIFVLILLLLPILSHFYSELKIFEEKIPQISLEEGLNKETLKTFIQNLTGSIVEEVSWKGETFPNEKKKLAEKAEKMEEIVQKKIEEIEPITKFFIKN